MIKIIIFMLAVIISVVIANLPLILFPLTNIDVKVYMILCACWYTIIGASNQLIQKKLENILE